MDCAESRLSKTKAAFFRNAAVAFSSLLLMANVTAVRFDGERWVWSKIAPDCSPIWRSTITASNFRQFKRRMAAASSRQTSGEIDNCCKARLNSPMVTGSTDTKSATQIDILSTPPYKVVMIVFRLLVLWHAARECRLLPSAFCSILQAQKAFAGRIRLHRVPWFEQHRHECSRRYTRL